MESVVNTVRNALERNAHWLEGFRLIDAVVCHRSLDAQCVNCLSQFIVDGGVARKVTETVGFAFGIMVAAHFFIARRFGV